MNLNERPIIYCETVGQRRFLELCVHLCDKRKADGPLAEVYSGCSVAISKHRCPVVQQLYPKQRGKHARDVQPHRDAADCGLTRRESAVEQGSETKPQRVSRRSGQKEALTSKKQRGRSDNVLLPLRRQGVPKNKRQNKKG